VLARGWSALWLVGLEAPMIPPPTVPDRRYPRVPDRRVTIPIEGPRGACEVVAGRRQWHFARHRPWQAKLAGGGQSEVSLPRS
jgi:hypothetical protein